MNIQRVSPPCTSVSSYCWKYNVFLSFRGEDTRKNFTDHLYSALTREGVNVFKDDKELERGKNISQELLKAIEESEFLVIVFSKTYAFSTWCLDELVKIVDSMNTKEHTVIPIFYGVDPSEVRKQKGSFREAFAKYEEIFWENIDKVHKWRGALTKVTDISGWDAKDRHESELIKDIVKEISSNLSIPRCINIKDLVGLHSRLQELRTLIDVGSDDVRMIGVCGMGGIGKTTIARVVYDMISSEFDGSSFLANVREISENGDMISLQNQLLSQTLRDTDINIHDIDDGVIEIRKRLRYKKVLVVIDDVAHVNQLYNLADHEWFGLGSRIIITTRDESLLRGVDQVYKIEVLNDDDALLLFCWKAFKKHQPPINYIELSKCIVKYANGLPLALEVLGSFLFGRTVDDWKSTIERLNRDPETKIINKLQLSFDGLKQTEKKIFLDIACFFKGKSRDYVTRILDACGFSSRIGISVLIEKSLINISEHNILWMHDLLQEMGRQIVKRESPEEPGKRSRVWEKADVHHVLRNNTGTEVVEGIIIKEELNFSVCAKAFSKMINLRLLKIKNVQLPEGLEYLSNKLRLLKWHGYPLKSLPSNLQADKVVELNLHFSSIEQLWKGTKHLNMLTSISLKNCQNLIEIQDLTCAPNLEQLCLDSCPRLRVIHHSPLLVHKKLIHLKVKNCSGLTTLSSKIHMEFLKEFTIVGCPKLKKFPEIVGRMKRLRLLCFNGTAIKEMLLPIELLTRIQRLILANNKNLVTLPSSLEGLKYLKILDLSGCPNLVSLPSTINGLKSLKRLNLSGCCKLESLPSTINGLKCLKYLNLSGCSSLTCLPMTINGLECLRTLKLSCCSILDNVPKSLEQVKSLEEIDLSGTAITQPTRSIFLMENLKELSFRGCKGPPSKSWHLHLPVNLMPRSSKFMAFMLPSLSSSCSLTNLELSDCNLGEGAIPCDFFPQLTSLQKLNLSRNNFVSLPATISHIPELQYLNLDECKRLLSLPELPPSTYCVYLNGCAALETLSNAVKSYNSECSFISCVNCFKLCNGSSLMLSMLKDFLKETLCHKESFSMVVPGIEIPRWLRYQREGSSIKIKRPPDLFDNKLVGYVVCSIFVVHKHPPVLCSDDYTHQLNCLIEMDGKKSPVSFYTDFDEKLGQAIFEHLWLLYLYPKVDFAKRWEDKYKHIRFSFEERKGQGWEVKSCGVLPIYEQDLKDFNPINSRQNFWSLN